MTDMTSDERNTHIADTSQEDQGGSVKSIVSRPRQARGISTSTLRPRQCMPARISIYSADAGFPLRRCDAASSHSPIWSFPGPKICSVQRMYRPRNAYSSSVFTHSHPPLNFSLHRLTLLSPVLIASTLPLKLQLTLHATASTFRTVDFHSPKSISALLLHPRSSTYASLRTSRCAQSYPGSPTQCTTWTAQSVTKRHRAPNPCVRAVSASSGRIRSRG